MSLEIKNKNGKQAVLQITKELFASWLVDVQALNEQIRFDILSRYTLEKQLQRYIEDNKLSHRQASQWLDILVNLAMDSRLDSRLTSSILNALIGHYLDGAGSKAEIDIRARLSNLRSLRLLAADALHNYDRRCVNDITLLDMTLVDDLILSILGHEKLNLIQLAMLAYESGQLLKFINANSNLPRTIELSTIKTLLTQLNTYQYLPEWPEHAPRLLRDIAIMAHAINSIDEELIDEISVIVEQLVTLNRKHSIDLPNIGRILGCLITINCPLSELTNELINTFKKHLTTLSPKFSQSPACTTSVHKVAKYLCFYGMTNTRLNNLKESGLPKWLAPHIYNPKEIKDKSFQHRIINSLKKDQELRDYALIEEAELVIWRGDLLALHKPSDQYLLLEVDGPSHVYYEDLRPEDYKRDLFLKSLTRPNGQPWLKDIKRFKIDSRTYGEAWESLRIKIIKEIKEYLLMPPHIKAKDAKISLKKTSDREKKTFNNEKSLPPKLPSSTAQTVATLSTDSIKKLSIAAAPFVPTQLKRDVILQQPREQKTIDFHSQTTRYHEKITRPEQPLHPDRKEFSPQAPYVLSDYDLAWRYECENNIPLAIQHYRLIAPTNQKARNRLAILGATHFNDPLAQYTLGRRYLTGDRIECDPLTGFFFLIRSAEQNNPNARSLLSDRVTEIFIIAQNLEKSKLPKNIEQAKELYYAISQYGNKDPQALQTAILRLKALSGLTQPVLENSSTKILLSGGSPYMTKEVSTMTSPSHDNLPTISTTK